MKKILKAFLFIWLLYLIYLNFFYKGTKILCAMGLPAASAITIALFAGILWVGLPISYFLKYLLDKFYKSSLTKNKILQTFFTIAKPLVFIFLLPLVFGMLIIFKAPPSLGDIIFSNKYLFFAVQFLGLVYIYLSLSAKFNKYLLK